MKKHEVQDKQQNTETEVSININTDENIEGTQHLNDPVAVEPELENWECK